ncbi:hypothetical protein ANTRET_LOCUS360, partial [Anthophora retusa]
MQVPGPESSSKLDQLSAKLKDVLGGLGAKIARPCKREDLRISGLDVFRRPKRGGGGGRGGRGVPQQRGEYGTDPLLTQRTEYRLIILSPPNCQRDGEERTRARSVDGKGKHLRKNSWKLRKEEKKNEDFHAEYRGNHDRRRTKRRGQKGNWRKGTRCSFYKKW